MRLFPSADYTFCELSSCSKKEECMRYIEHYPRLKEHPRLSIYLIEDETKCTLFKSNKDK